MPGAIIFIIAVTAVAMIALIVFIQRRKIQVQKTSVLIKNLMDLNEKYNFDWSIQQQYIFKTTLTSKAKLERYNLIHTLDEALLNYDEFNRALKGIWNNRIAYSDYSERLNGLSSEISLELLKELHISLSKYKSIEQKLFEAKKINPILNCQIVCIASYTSPKGRNRYEKEITYNADDVYALHKEITLSESDRANLTIEGWRKQFQEQQQRNFENDYKNRSKGLPEDVFVRNELAKIDAMNGLDFERYCARLLYMFGFKNVKVTPSSGDFGVDIIAIDGATTFAVQCKRYSGNLGAKPIQEVYTGMRHYGANNALVITNSFFSDKAKQLADETGVTLWDRSCLQLTIKKCLLANEPSNTQSDTNSRSHRKHIPHVAGTKEYVEMYIYKENLERVYLVSEPFDTLEEANHFSDCMNDRFGCSALIEEKEDKFYSHSNWIERYKINSNFQPDKNVYVFANWS